MCMTRSRIQFTQTPFIVLDTLSQFMIFRPLGIKVFNLHIQVNSLLSLSDLDLGMSLDNLMHSRICIVNRGLEISP